MPEGDKVVGPEDILSFWFEELSDKDWFQPTPELDEQIFRRFRVTHLQLSRQVNADWHVSPQARLAAVIVLDQLPRNMYRASPLAFSTDGLALREAKLAVAAGADQRVHARMRPFFYMPFEHSEVLADQDRCVQLFAGLDNAEFQDYARRHRDIILRFGRFPHRNAILGRETTPEETEFLKLPGSGF